VTSKEVCENHLSVFRPEITEVIQWLWFYLKNGRVVENDTYL